VLTLAAAPAPAQDWQLVWSDEFDGTELDTSKWRAEHAYIPKNNELQFYASDDVYVGHGVLTLRSQRRQMGQQDYTSGLVESRRRFAQTYGRVEVRARLPFGQGIWPAHWMLPEAGQWPPEIDIMELLGHEPRTVHMTHHWGTWPDTKNFSTPFTGPDFSDGFHVFRVDWEPGRLTWYVDGVERARSTANVPGTPFYLIINTAVGGHWPGNPDETTVFPQHMLVDYARVYVKDDPDRRYLWVRSPHGEVSAEPAKPVYSRAETVTLTAEPEFGHRFVRWEGDASGGDPSVRLTMDRNRRVRAVYEPDPTLPPRLTPASATATSAQGPGLGPEYAVDMNPGTRWSSEFSDPQTLTIDLGRAANVRIVHIRWENAYAKRYDLEGSLDGREWRTIRSVTKDGPAPDLLTDLDERVRYLRLNCRERATQWGCSVWEVEVYAER
jgi:beta-glucanase (GH16 family)